jgi:hypothetical protein
VGALALLAAVASARGELGGSAIRRAPPAAFARAARAASRRAVPRAAASMGAEPPTIAWLPKLGKEGPDTGPMAEDALTLPVFPLGSVCYLPFTSHVLNIFEPRYRSMYSDILFNGSRRFVVTMIDPETGQLAKTGVVFYLDDLKGVCARGPVAPDRRATRRRACQAVPVRGCSHLWPLPSRRATACARGRRVYAGSSVAAEHAHGTLAVRARRWLHAAAPLPQPSCALADPVCAVLRPRPPPTARARVSLVASLASAEVSEQTGDAVKYVCSHSVIGRVEIDRVLNPQAWSSRETYLKARVTLLAEPHAPVPMEAPSAREAELTAAFARLVAVQAETNEMPRFTEHMLRTLNVTAAQDDEALWRTIGAWHALQEERVLAVQQRMQADLSRRVIDYFREKNGPDASVPPRVRLEDLPADVRADLGRIQEGYRVQLEDVTESPFGEPFQLLLQAKGHEARLELFLAMVTQEVERLGRRASLKKLFDLS